MKRCKIVHQLMLLIFLIFIYGCATPVRPISSVQSDCEVATNFKFEYTVKCLRDRLSYPPYSNSEFTDLAQLYVSYAEALSSKVNNQQLSVQDARFQLSLLYVQLKNNQDSRIYQSQASMNMFLQQLSANINTNQKTTIAPITCTKMGNITRCY